MYIYGTDAESRDQQVRALRLPVLDFDDRVSQKNSPFAAADEDLSKRSFLADVGPDS